MTGSIPKAFLAMAIGDVPLPVAVQEKAAFVRWAQLEHILGQVAAAQDASDDQKLAQILDNARVRSSYDQRMLTYEADRVRRALMGSGIRPTLLKGSAYVAAHLPAGLGRRVSDIDILVREEDLRETERLLTDAGWIPEATTADQYDQSYYRDWMHELPPLRHKVRRTLIDVHHRLLPRTARLKPDHLSMMKDAKTLEGRSLKTFQPLDRFIHSAIHIFADGALETPARSLIELAYLFRDLSDEEKAALLERSRKLNCYPPVVTALWAIDFFFDDRDARKAREGHRPTTILRWWISAVTLQSRTSSIARLGLYVRSHYMRMPIFKLVRHLLKKATRRG